MGGSATLKTGWATSDKVVVRGYFFAPSTDRGRVRGVVRRTRVFGHLLVPFVWVLDGLLGLPENGEGGRTAVFAVFADSQIAYRCR